MRPRRGNVWKLTEKGIANHFVSEMFERYDMQHNIVPGKWILAGYVIEVPEETKEVKGTENECSDVRDADGTQESGTAE